MDITTDQLADLADPQGATIDIGNGLALRLTVGQDETTNVNDDDCYGRIEWGTTNDYGEVRPDGFDGRARILRHDSHGSLWWQPPSADYCPADQRDDLARRVSELAEYGFSYVAVALVETVTDSLGGTHDVTVDSASLGGLDVDDHSEWATVLADLLPDLVADVLADLDFEELAGVTA